MTDDELNGHIERAEECRDFLHHEAMDEGDPTGKLTDFADSLRIVLEQLASTQHRLREREEEVEKLRAPEKTVVGDDEVNRVARVMMAEWERVEREPVNISRWATFADLARVVVADTVRMRRDYLYWSEQSDKWRGEYAREFGEHKHTKEQLATVTRERDEWQRIAEERHRTLEETRKDLGDARAHHDECSANWERLQMQIVRERDSALQALSSAAEKGVAAGKLVGEAELKAMTRARGEACDIAYRLARNNAADMEATDRIAELRRVGKEGK